MSFLFLVLELLHPPQLADTESAVDLPSTIERLFRHAHPPDHLRHWRAGLRLLQRERDLLLGVALPALPANATLQQLFDAASAADGRDERDVALSIYDAIEQRLGTKGSVSATAITRARRGVLLSRMGRPRLCSRLTGLRRVRSTGQPACAASRFWPQD